ncbi:unnamed protein product [Malus baccata var. baccata]
MKEIYHFFHICLQICLMLILIFIKFISLLTNTGKNDAVEASASDIDYELVASKIDVGSCYEIMKFLVPHETHVIFTGTTMFKKLSTVFPPIPGHRFFLLDFNMLYARLNRGDILTDVIGHIIAVQQLESKQINQRLAQKCDIHIENIRLFFSLTKRRIVCYIVGKYCRSFLFFIDPEVVFADYCCIYKFKSQDLPRYKVNLILEDNTNEINLVMNHRLIDQQKLPNEFLRLIRQKKIFHFDVLVYNVCDDTAIEPITPQILPRAVTVSSTIVSSSTSPPETSGESHKRKR